MQPDYDDACWAQAEQEQHRQEEEQAEALLRFEIARTVEMVAEHGHCPEKAKDMERSLLQVAGLEKFDLAA